LVWYCSEVETKRLRHKFAERSSKADPSSDVDGKAEGVPRVHANAGAGGTATLTGAASSAGSPRPQSTRLAPVVGAAVVPAGQNQA
jgi:hypothetical protein